MSSDHHGEPAGHPPAPPAFSPRQAELAELCLRAADLHDISGWTYLQIAGELGFATPQQAYKAAHAGRKLAADCGDTAQRRNEAFVAEINRLALRQLESAAGRLLSVVTSPVPLVVNGSVVTDPSTGEPVPDTALLLEAVRLMLDIHDRIRQITGPSPLLSMTAAEIGTLAAQIRDQAGDAGAGEQDQDAGDEDGSQDDEGPAAP